MSYKWLESAMLENPDKVAVKYKGKTLNYRQLYMKAHELSTHLETLNQKRVGLLIDNSFDSVILIHGLMLHGVEMVLLNTRLTGHEIRSQLDDVVVDTVITTVQGEIPDTKMIHFDELYDLPSATAMVNQPDADDILSIMFTSGTTGRSKAVPQTYGNHQASHNNCQNEMNYNEDSVWMMVNPIFHISGLSVMFRTVMSQSTLILVNKFDPESVWSIIENEEVSHTSMVPVMLKRLLKFEGKHFLEGILLGGASTTPKLLKTAIDKGLPVYNSFGMTETCSQIVQISSNDKNILSGTVGNINTTATEIKLDESTHELLIKGDSVVKEYLNADMDHTDGYFNTGDVASIDDDGYIYILDRRNDLIISGGENIYPKEIEDVVYMLEEVNRCVVIKKDDDEWGQVPVLLLEEPVDKSRLLNHLYEHLAKYKIPREIHYVDEIKLTSTGKISRTINRNMFLDLDEKVLKDDTKI